MTKDNFHKVIGRKQGDMGRGRTKWLLQEHLFEEGIVRLETQNNVGIPVM